MLNNVFQIYNDRVCYIYYAVQRLRANKITELNNEAYSKEKMLLDKIDIRNQDKK